eukprot:m.171640 g.171640  ORF g.171640 m.171640 type:complete len:175 (-) comp14818_c0_seq3:2071-2595(-)
MRSNGRERGRSEVDAQRAGAGEILSAVTFLCHTMKELPSNFPEIPTTLEQLMLDRWTGHWHPDEPERGSAYRCISVSGGRLDPLLRAACDKAGVDADSLCAVLPQDFTLWTDPGSVSVRMGPTGPIWPLEQFSAVETDFGMSSEASRKPRALDPWAKEWMPTMSSGSSSASSSP